MKKLMLGLLMAFAANVVLAEETPDYLSFTATGGNVTIGMKWSYGTPKAVHTFEWSVDKASWTEFLTGSSNMTVHAGETVYFRRKGESTDTLNPGETGDGWMFTMSPESAGATIAAGGNVMSLLDATCQKTDVGVDAFMYLFYKCTALTAAPNLPATMLATRCYESMFDDCTALTAAPKLPATTLAEKCYNCMFYGCTALTAAPELPAKMLVTRCYAYMFSGCTALTAAPDLPAERLEASCYDSMFSGCTALTAAPDLPAEILEASCYDNMFSGCTALTAAPALPATTLAMNCYASMFSGCTALTAAPDLPAERLEASCYASMFKGCTALGWVKVGFSAWKSMNSFMWLSDVATNGLFVCPSTLDDQRGDNAIPSSWTKVDANDSVRFIFVPKVEHLKTTVTTNESEVTAYAGSTCWMVRQGAAVQVTFSADEGYAVEGTASYSIEALTDDVTFGRTEGYPLPTVAEGADAFVRFQRGTGVDCVLFACNGATDFIEFPLEGMSLQVGTIIDLRVTTAENYRYTGETQFTVPEAGLDETITATEIAWGDKERPWTAGETVTAYTNGTTFVVEGSGAMYDFVSEDEVPWAEAAKEVTAVTIEEGVTLGKNALAGMDNLVTINEKNVESNYRTVSTVNGMSIEQFNVMGEALGNGTLVYPSQSPVIPDDMVLVTKEALQAAKAMTVQIVNGQIELSVSVCSNADITASTANWAPVKFSPDAQIGLSADGTKLILPIPVDSQSGFMILQSGDAKAVPSNGAKQGFYKLEAR